MDLGRLLGDPQAVAPHDLGPCKALLTGERLSGTLRLTNLAGRRTDNVNLPTLRGVLDTADGARVWVELDAVATLRAENQARVFVTTFRFGTGDERYIWLNTASLRLATASKTSPRGNATTVATEPTNVPDAATHSGRTRRPVPDRS